MSRFANAALFTAVASVLYLTFLLAAKADPGLPPAPGSVPPAAALDVAGGLFALGSAAAFAAAAAMLMTRFSSAR